MAGPTRVQVAGFVLREMRITESDASLFMSSQERVHGAAPLCQPGTCDSSPGPRLRLRLMRLVAHFGRLLPNLRRACPYLRPFH
jgi:hypothetical protein